MVVEVVITPGLLEESVCRGSRSTVPSPTGLDVGQLARLTGLSLPAGPEAVDGSRSGLEARPTRLEIKLLGTLLGSSGSWSIASVVELGRQKTSTVMVGGRVQDARVLEILRDGVIIDHGGRREIIGMDPGEGVLGPSAPALTQVLTVRPLDEGHYEVSRSELDAALTRIDHIAEQVRIVPAYRDGQPEGFKVFAMRPDSLFSKLGLVNGDVVRRINGFEMNSPANALEVYARLRDATRIDVELERGSSSIRKSYSIR
jgi:general secretion pathway protein C